MDCPTHLLIPSVVVYTVLTTPQTISTRPWLLLLAGTTHPPTHSTHTTTHPLPLTQPLTTHHSPNDMALPIMILSTICDNDTINLDYGSSSKQCYTEGTSMLFVYSIGWHLIFWSYGFPILKSLKEEQLLADTTAESSNSSASASAPIPITLLSVSNPPQLLRDEVDRDSSNSTNNRSSHGSRINSSLSLCKLKVLQSLLWLLSVLSSPAMMAIIVGVTISLIPPLQRMLFEDMSIFRPLGSAITTLGEPVVATSCLIMSASLANVDLSRGRPRIHHTESDGIGGVEMTAVDSEIAIVRSPLQSALHAVKEYALLRGNFGLASTHGSIHGGGNNSDQR